MIEKSRSFIDTVKEVFKESKIQFVLIAFIFLIGLLFIEPISDLFNRIIVSPWLSKIKRGFITDFIVAALFTSFIILYYKGIIKFSSAVWILILFLCSCMILKGSSYTYLHFRIIHSVAYIWCFAIAIFISFCLDLSKYFKSKHVLFNDNSPEKGDTLGRTLFVNEITQAILNTSLSINESKALAILGEWGSGKTFTLNQVKETLKKSESELILIDFNPWDKNQGSSITSNFLEILGEKLSKSNVELARKLKSYSEGISRNDSTGIVKILNDFISHLLPKTIDTANYEEVNLTIRRSRREIVVFIDDVDRLFYTEVMEVLKLIRNTANFAKITYVVAFSKSYVVHAIGQFNAYNPNGFIEKIFNAQYELPPIEDISLLNNLSRIVRSNPSLSLHADGIIEALKGYRPPSGMLFQDFIQNIRDVERYCEILHFESRTHLGRLNVKDLVLVKLIRFKYPSICSRLVEFRKVFFILESRNGNLPAYRLRTRAELHGDDFSLIDGAYRKSGHLGVTDDLLTEKDTPVLTDYLMSFPFMQKNDIEIFLSTLRRLLKTDRLVERRFSVGSGITNSYVEFDQDFIEEYRGFQNPDYFPSYFSGDNLEYIQIESFIQCLNSDEDVLKLCIENWLRLGKVEIIFALTKKYKPLKTLNLYNKSSVLILMANYQVESVGMVNDIYLQELANIISGIGKVRFGTVLPLDFNRSDYFRWLQQKSVFFPLIVSRLNMLVSEFELEAPFDRESLYDSNFKIFETYCSNRGALNFEFWNLRNNSRKVVLGIGEELVSNEAKSLASKYFRENYDARDLGRFIISNGSEICFDLGDNQTIMLIFGSIEQFELWIFSDYFDSINKQVQLFRAIFSELKQNGFAPIKYQKEWQSLVNYN